jgi:hypothetical protein
VGQAQQAIGALAENLGYGPSDGSEAHEGHPARSGALRGIGRRFD